MEMEHWDIHESESEVAQSCLTPCDPMDYSLPCSSIHGIFQARVLEWVAISFSRGSSWPRDRTWVSHIVGRCFTIWATREAPYIYRYRYIYQRPTTEHISKFIDLAVLSLHCCVRSSLVVASGGSSLAAVCWLHTAVASVGEHGL